MEQSQSKALHSCLETSPLNAQKWLDSCEDMNTAFPDLLNDVREEVEERNVGKHCR